MHKRNGISLIVLIITIIIIIILAGVVIMGINNNRIISNTNKTVFINKVLTYKDSLEMYHSNQISKHSYKYIPENIFATGAEMKTYIKEMKEEDYNKFKIEKGKLIYIGDDVNEEEWSSEVIENELYNFVIKVDSNDENSAKVKLELKINTEEEKDKDKVYTIKVENINLPNDKYSKIIDTKNNIDKNIIEYCNFDGLKPDNVYRVSATVLINGKKTISTKKSEEKIFKTSKDDMPPIDAIIEFIDKNNNLIKQESISEFPITAKVILKDYDLGNGIDLSSSKYIFNKNASVNINEFNTLGKSFDYNNNVSIIPDGSINVYIDLSNFINTNGDYYLHVLSVDNSQNKKITTSEPLKYEKNIEVNSDKIIIDVEGENNFAKEYNVSIKCNNPYVKEILYKKPGYENWFTYNGIFKVNQNGEINVIGKDEAGNKIINKNKTISKIDNENPIVTIDPETLTNVKEVSVNINAIDYQSGISEIKYQWRENNNKLDVNDSSWRTANSISNNKNLNKGDITGNIYLHLRVTDNVGNAITCVGGVYTLDNTGINLDGLNIVTEKQGFQKEALFYIVGITQEMKEIRYKVPGSKDFLKYENKPFNVNENGKLEIKVLDALGNESITERTISVIDNEPPSLPYVNNSSKGNVTRDPVNITIESTDYLSGLERYEWFNGTSWVTDSIYMSNDGVGSITFEENMNKDIRFRAVDKVGNISKESVTRVNIDKNLVDKTGPNITVSDDLIYTITKKATITDASPNLMEIQYSIDKSKWQRYKEPIVINKNCTLSAKSIDLNGNEIGISTVEITKIDNVKPTISDFEYTVTNNSITVSNVVCNDNVGITSYRFLLSDRKSSNFLKEPFYTFTNLSPKTSYDLTVMAYDQAGNFTSLAKKNITTSEEVIYKINYDANGGSGAPKSQTKSHGQTIKLSDQRPTRDGYIFLGWNKDKNATNIEYLPGSNYVKDNDEILYAVWKEDTRLVAKAKEGSYIEIPGSTTRWIVLYKNSYGINGIEAISEDTVKNVTLGKIGEITKNKSNFLEAINKLNNESEIYVKENILKYVNMARCVGSKVDDPGYLGVISESLLKFYPDHDYEDINDINLTNTHHQVDYDQMKKLGINNINKEYWLASRYSDGTTFETFYSVRLVGKKGELTSSVIFDIEPTGKVTTNNNNKGLRPCIRLYSDINVIGGDGSKNNPFKIQR